ncbi:Ribonucleotide reductase subunit alpha [uncultured Defluviicoccus sp.]|uniref:ribonucleoside-diphosphate reductase n=1 Tax=metagenome TaxID=256318 RepID=A0A380TLC1_9ZZZZ|nr:Ribonucleotide reductase subunit alpha [uncultured Defluviicoccus sp.]
MPIKISKKIKGYAVAKPEDKAAAPAATPAAEPDEVMQLPKAEVIQMHEQIERPDVLIGSTYKIKSPLFEHALYVTINDIVLNQGTEHELRRPFEIFINSKNMDHFQWIVALTRIMSAVFRKGGDVTFLVEEMKAVFDPRGGYFKGGGVYMPSIVAEIGAVVEDHMKMIGLIRDPEMSDATKALIAEKRAAYEAQQAKKKTELAVPPQSITSPSPPVGEGWGEGCAAAAPPSASIPGDLAGAGAASARHTSPESTDTTASTSTDAIPGASVCPKCSAKALVIMDGCATCLSCGYSKCG